MDVLHPYLQKVECFKRRNRTTKLARFTPGYSFRSHKNAPNIGQAVEARGGALLHPHVDLHELLLQILGGARFAAGPKPTRCRKGLAVGRGEVRSGILELESSWWSEIWAFANNMWVGHVKPYRIKSGSKLRDRTCGCSRHPPRAPCLPASCASPSSASSWYPLVASLQGGDRGGQQPENGVGAWKYQMVNTI